MAEANQGPEVFGPGTTGRTLVALEPYQVEAGANALSEIAEVSIESSRGGSGHPDSSKRAGDNRLCPRGTARRRVAQEE
jgi:hypothetical protein